MIARFISVTIPHPLDALYYATAWLLVALAYRRAGWPVENVKVLASPMAWHYRSRLLTPRGVIHEWEALKRYTEHEKD